MCNAPRIHVFSEPRLESGKLEQQRDRLRKVESVGTTVRRHRSSEGRLVRDCVSSLYFISRSCEQSGIERKGIGYLMSPFTYLEYSFQRLPRSLPLKILFSFLFLLSQPLSFILFCLFLLAASLPLVRHRQSGIFRCLPCTAPRHGNPAGTLLLFSAHNTLL